MFDVFREITWKKKNDNDRVVIDNGIGLAFVITVSVYGRRRRRRPAAALSVFAGASIVKGDCERSAAPVFFFFQVKIVDTP